MLMYDKIIFDRYYCINTTTQTKEIMVHYILQPHHIFIRVKAFIMLVPGGLQFLIVKTGFAWRPVTSISKSHVSTARARVNCNINAWLSLR